MGLLLFRPDGSTAISPLRVYCYFAPMGLLLFRPYGATPISPLWVYCYFAPTGLLLFRPYGATAISPLRGYHLNKQGRVRLQPNWGVITIALQGEIIIVYRKMMSFTRVNPK